MNKSAFGGDISRGGANACVLAAAVLAASCLVAPRAAQACSAPGCTPGAALPSTGEFPSNAASFVYRAPRSGQTPAAMPRLYRVEGDRNVELDVTLREQSGLQVISPTVPVEEGAELVLEWSQVCDSATYAPPGPAKIVHARAKVAAARPLPTDLGTLRIESRRGSIPVPDSMCSVSLDAAFVDLTVELSASAQPYHGLLRYELRVDGEARASYRDATGWPTTVHLGGSSLGRGKDRIYTVCSRSDPDELAVAPGRHRVSMVGVLPDGSSIASEEVEVELRCDGDAGVPLGAPGAATVSAPNLDAAVDAEAAARSDASATAEAPISSAEPHLPSTVSSTSEEERTGDGTEGCALRDADSRSPAWLFATITALMLLRRRRRRA